MEHGGHRGAGGPDHPVVLCVGDLHLGRAPSRIPDALLDHDPAVRRELTPAAAWLRLARSAVERGVDAVVLLGDIVDDRNALLEATGPFSRGVAVLREAGIPVVAVVGNHDVAELPRLVDATDGIELLGRGGTWQARILERPGRAPVRLLGWSFPTRRVTTSPLADLGGWDDAGAGSIPTLGLLHCDLDTPGSHHAPVRRAELDAVQVDAWLLGHIHKPDLLDGPRPTGYLGSVAPLDPGEPGWHGAWLAHCERDGVRMERLPGAVHRYETIELDIGTLGSADDLLPALTERIRALHDSLDAASGDLRLVVGRLRLVGEHADHAAIVDGIQADGGIAQHWIELDGIRYGWEPTIRDDARPALDLASLSTSGDIVAPVASMLVGSGAGASIDPALVASIRRRLERDVLAAPAFRDPSLAAVDLDDAAIEALALAAARDVLQRVEEVRGR